MKSEEAWRPRFDPTGPPGHYESWFLRANHPVERRAFWLRYTVYWPKHGGPAEGELWAIVFEGDEIVAAKQGFPIDVCTFGPEHTIGDALLSRGLARGGVNKDDQQISWDLSWKGTQPPLLLLDESLYAAPLPKAKALVTLPLAEFTGSVMVNGTRHVIDGWIGSENHNWGQKHTDRYAWGQVAGFDEAPNAFLEVSTAQVDIGPLRSPWLTPIVLRMDDHEYALNTIARAIRNRGHYDIKTLRWTFSGHSGGFFGQRPFSIEGRFEAPQSAFVGLPYRNPIGGTKVCLNTKIAKCVIEITLQGKKQRLSSSRAAFEILTDPPVTHIPVMSDV